MARHITRAHMLGCVLLTGVSIGAARTRRALDPTDCFNDRRAIEAPAARDLPAIARGDAVITTTDLPGRRWPRVCAYRFVNATPEQSLAVLADYPLRPSYIPDVKVSNVVPPTADSTTKRVAYVIHVLLRINETDTLREVVRQLDSPPGAYRLEWSSISSSMAKSIAGSATFVPWRRDSVSATGTLMIYQQTVEPGSRLAGLPFIKGRGIDAVRNAAVAIGRQVEVERTQHPQQLQRQVAELRRTLASDPHRTPPPSN